MSIPQLRTLTSQAGGGKAMQLFRISFLLRVCGLAVALAFFTLSTARAQTVSFMPRRDLAVGTAPISVAVGDFNGDGIQDLAVANRGSNNVSVLLGNGDGTFQAAVNYGVGLNPESVAIGDFNGDGKPHLAVADVASNDVSVLINNTPTASAPNHAENDRGAAAAGRVANQERQRIERSEVIQSGQVSAVRQVGGEKQTKQVSETAKRAAMRPEGG